MADSELKTLKNLGEKRLKALSDAGIYTFSDLARFFRALIGIWTTYAP